MTGHPTIPAAIDIWQSRQIESLERQHAAIMAGIERAEAHLRQADETLFPNMAQAARHLSTLSPERRKELEKLWEQR